MKAYLDNDPVGIRETFHQEFKRLEASGILAIKWHNPNILVQYIQLLNADALASEISYNRLSNRFEMAKLQIESQLTDSPHLKAIEAELFNKWQQTGNYEGFSVEDPNTLIQSINAADAMLDITSEVDERHFSIQVLGDSKKLKGLMGKIAKLHRLRDQEIPEAISKEEVFQLFGVVPLKHPVYLSGPVRLFSIKENLSITADFPPGIGLWPDYVDSVSCNADIQLVTSIENHATFLRYIEQEKTKDELVIFTSGIPSPAFRKLYRLIVAALPDALLRHWGDIDVGGFTILNILEKTAERSVAAYRMTPNYYVGCKDFGRLTSSESKRLSGLAERLSAKNRDVVLEVIDFKMKYEQESFRQSITEDG